MEWECPTLSHTNRYNKKNQNTVNKTFIQFDLSVPEYEWTEYEYFSLYTDFHLFFPGVWGYRWVSGPTWEWRLHCQLALLQLYSKTTGTGVWLLSHCLIACFWLCLCCPHQGSFRCGECKTGFTGDQVRGCHGTRLCPNGLPNPCDTNAECVVERDGSISCVVRI